MEGFRRFLESQGDNLEERILAAIEDERVTQGQFNALYADTSACQGAGQLLHLFVEKEGRAATLVSEDGAPVRLALRVSGHAETDLAEVLV